LQAQETARRFDFLDQRFDSLERMINNLKGGPPMEPLGESRGLVPRGVQPRVKERAVDIAFISKQIQDIDIMIKAKQNELNGIVGHENA
jgi:hypothetical protein